MNGTKKAVAVGGGVIAAIAVGVAQHMGALADDVGRGAGRVLEERPQVLPRNPALGGVLNDALTDPTVSGSVKEGITTFRSLRKGTDDQRVIVGVACRSFDAFASNQATTQDFQQYIDEQVPSVVPRSVVRKYSSPLANGLYAAQLSGGLARWYGQYCVFPAR